MMVARLGLLGINKKGDVEESAWRALLKDILFTELQPGAAAAL